MTEHQELGCAFSALGARQIARLKSLVLSSTWWACPLYPSDLTFSSLILSSESCQEPTSVRLFDHLVGVHLQSERHGKAEYLRGLKIGNRLHDQASVHVSPRGGA